MEEIRRLAEQHIRPTVEKKLRWLGNFDVVVSALQSSGLSTLFDNQHRKYGSSQEVDRVDKEVYKVCTAWRQLGHYDRANQLEALLASFSSACSEGVFTEGKAILLFLLTLAETDLPPAPSGCTARLPSDRQQLSSLLQEGKTNPVYPTHRPLDYSDTCVSRQQQPSAADPHRPVPYMQYNSGIFSSLAARPGTAMRDECAGQPVADWLQTCSRPYWMQHAQHCAPHSQDGSLFGAVSHGFVSHLGQHLKIPPLASPPDGQEPKLSDVLTSLRATTSSSTSSLDRLQDLLLSRRSIDDPRMPQHGISDRPSGQAYLSEAGPEVFDAVLVAQALSIRHVDAATATETASSVFSQADIVADCCTAMLGAESLTFPLGQDGLLTVDCHRCCSGFSGLGLRHVLQPMATWGNAYSRLHALTCSAGSRRGSASGGAQAGRSTYGTYSLVQHAFVDGLVSYLQCYRAALLDLGADPASRNILSLHSSLAPLGRQLLFTLSISTAASSDAKDKLLPTCELLSSLYKQASERQHSAHYSALLHLLNAAIQPYLQFLHRWLEYGKWDDSFGEFFVRVNEDSLSYRDTRYWTKGYTVARDSSDSPAVPSFLLPIADSLLACGKTIDLLQECCPEHVFLTDGIPRMDITLWFSLEGLQRSMTSCLDFVQQREDLLQGLRDSHVEATQDLAHDMQMAEDRRAEIVKQDEDEKMSRLQVERVRREKALAELRETMMADIQRRADIVEKERQDDAAYIQGLVDRDERLTQLEAEARAELVAHYQRLTADAENRRLRSEWRAQRLALQSERLNLLNADADANAADGAADMPTAADGSATSEPPVSSESALPKGLLDVHSAGPSAPVSAVDGEAGSSAVLPLSGTDSVTAATSPPVSAHHTSTAGTIPKQTPVDPGEPVSRSLNDNASTAEQSAEFVQDTLPGPPPGGKPANEEQSIEKVMTSPRATVPSALPKSAVAPVTVQPADGSPASHTASQSSLSSQYSNADADDQVTRDADELDSHVELATATDSCDSTRRILSSMKASGLQPLSLDFSGLDKLPPIAKALAHETADDTEEADNLDAIDAYPLSVIMTRCVLDPLLAQCRLANVALIQHFRYELKIGAHFAALRRFLLLECGEFGQALGERLFHQLSSGQPAHAIRSPMALSDLLSHALQQSQMQDTADAERLSFSIRRTSGNFQPTAIGAFNFLHINYQIDWPLNIVITEENMSKYNKVFLFLLEMKRASWLLKDCLFYLKTRVGQDVKRSQLVCRSPQFRQVQLFRHEMQHFVQSVEGYLANQVIQVSWKEFQVDLAEEVQDLNSLVFCHSEYLRKLLFRSFLSQKAAPVMKVVTEVLATVLRFHAQLLSGSWLFSGSQDKHLMHSNFASLCTTHQSFKKYSGFLFNVVTKMVQRGYQSHLDEFLLCLNFNAFYKPIRNPDA